MTENHRQFVAKSQPRYHAHLDHEVISLFNEDKTPWLQQSQSNVRVVSFPFTFETPGLAEGVLVEIDGYVPEVGDVLFEIWIERIEAWDETAKADFFLRKPIPFRASNHTYADGDIVQPRAKTGFSYVGHIAAGISGATEPEWPTEGDVEDGTINWGNTPLITTDGSWAALTETDGDQAVLADGSLWFSSSGAGTTGSTEPDWTTAPIYDDDTVEDGDITWIRERPYVGAWEAVHRYSMVDTGSAGLSNPVVLPTEPAGFAYGVDQFLDTHGTTGGVEPEFHTNTNPTLDGDITWTRDDNTAYDGFFKGILGDPVDMTNEDSDNGNSPQLGIYTRSDNDSLLSAMSTVLPCRLADPPELYVVVTDNGNVPTSGSDPGASEGSARLVMVVGTPLES